MSRLESMSKNELLAEVEALQKDLKCSLATSGEASAKQLAELGHIYETAPIGMCILDSELRYTRINQRLAEINGKSIEEHLGKTVQEVLPELAPEIAPLFQRILETGVAVEEVEVTGTTPAAPDVERTWMVSYYPIRTPDGKVFALGAIVQEITARKKAEYKKAKLKRIIDNTQKLARTGGWEHDVLSGETFWTENLYRLFGYAPEEIEDLHPFFFQNIVAPKDQDKIEESWNAVLSGRRVEIEYTVVKKDGEERIINGVVTPVLNDRGEVVRVNGANQDITDKKRAEEHLLKSEQEYRDIFDSATDCFFVSSEDGLIMNANKRACETYGYTLEELKSMKIRDIMHKDYWPAHQRFREELAKTGAFEGETVDVRKDGAAFPAQVKGAYIQYRGARRLLCVRSDITEQKRVEKIQAANRLRLEALYGLGRMTGQSDAEILHFALEASVRITQSKGGYVYFVNDEETQLTLFACAEAGKPECETPEARQTFDVASPGLWSAPVRLRSPVITNEGALSGEDLALPHGKSVMRNHVGLPVFEGSRMVLLVGVGDKNGDFDDTDIELVSAVMSEAWRIIRFNRNQAETELHKKRSESLFRMSQMQNKQDDELIQFALEEAVSMTGSKVGHLHMIGEDQTSIQDRYWSKAGQEACQAQEIKHNSLDTAGAWATCVSQKETIINNKYQAGSSETRLPPGHMPISRFMSVPVLVEGNVAGVLGVANKESDYNEFDALQLKVLMDGLFKVLQQRNDREALIQARDALNRSEKRFRSLVENLQEGIWEIDADSITTFVNPRMADMLGYTPEEMEGRHLFSFMDERGVEICTRNLERREQGIAEQHDFEFRHKDGHVVFTALGTHPTYDDEGEYAGAVAAVADITVRRNYEENLRVSQERLEMALSASELGMWDWNLETGEAHFDKDWLGMLGYQPGELKGHVSTWAALLHPDDREETLAVLEESNALNVLYRAEFRLKAKDDRWKWILSTGKVVEWDETGKPVRMTGVHLDINDRRKREEELQTKLAVQDALSRLYALLVSPEKTIVDISDALYEESRGLTGAQYALCATIDPDNGSLIPHTLDRLLGKDCRMSSPKKLRFLPDDSGKYPALWGHCLNEKTAFFTNEPQMHVSSEGTPKGHIQIQQFLAVPVILGDRKAGLIALANKEAGFGEQDLANIQEMARYYGLAIQGIEAQQELSRSEKRYRHLVESMNEGIVILGEDGAITFVNSLICEMLGLPRSEILGKHLHDFVDSANQDYIVERMKNTSPEQGGNYELLLHNANGDKVFTLVSPTPLLDEDDLFRGVIAVVTNITELKILETKLLQAQKLESIGQLAAGIAHEINTPTQYVDNNIRFLQENMDGLLDLVAVALKLTGFVQKGDQQSAIQELARLLDEHDYHMLLEEVPEALEDSLNGLDRIAKIVQSVKQLAHPGRAEKEYLNINDAVKSTVTVATNEWKYVADLTMDLDEDAPLILGYRAELNQVFLNLIINSAQSIQEKMGASQTEKGAIAISTKKVGAVVQIQVADTGMGIPESIREKVFDPFFTTKEVGKGTGQGLAISYSVIQEQHGGELSFESQEGEGTTFTILLPVEG